MSGIIGASIKHVPDEQTRTLLYRDIIDVLRAKDWDTMDECLGEDIAYDAIYNEMYPNED
jgi:hypothetical protein